MTGWDVLVVQKELHSEDRHKLWGSPVRVYAAPPGTPRPDPARAPEEQGWQELTRGGILRRPRAPGTGAWFQERLVDLLVEGNPWVVGHWRRLAENWLCLALLHAVGYQGQVAATMQAQPRMLGQVHSVPWVSASGSTMAP